MKCNYCGKELQPKVIHLFNRDYTVGYLECDCMGAKATAAAEAKAEASKRDNDRAKKREWYYLKAGIPKRYLQHVVEPSQKAIESCLSHGLYISGNVGVGKTTMAAEIARKLLDDGKSVKFANVTTLIDEIRDTYSGGSTSGAISRLVRYDMLVVDDIGKEYMSKDALSLIYRVIDGRYSAMRQTIYTSNYSISALAQKIADSSDRVLGESIASRMRECEEMRLGGTDRRKK